MQGGGRGKTGLSKSEMEDVKKEPSKALTVNWKSVLSGRSRIFQPPLPHTDGQAGKVNSILQLMLKHISTKKEKGHFIWDILLT